MAKRRTKSIKKCVTSSKLQISYPIPNESMDLISLAQENERKKEDLLLFTRALPSKATDRNEGSSFNSTPKKHCTNKLVTMNTNKDITKNMVQKTFNLCTRLHVQQTDHDSKLKPQTSFNQVDDHEYEDVTDLKFSSPISYNRDVSQNTLERNTEILSVHNVEQNTFIDHKYMEIGEITSSTDKLDQHVHVPPKSFHRHSSVPCTQQITQSQRRQSLNTTSTVGNYAEIGIVDKPSIYTILQNTGKDKHRPRRPPPSPPSKYNTEYSQADQTIKCTNIQQPKQKTRRPPPLPPNKEQQYTKVSQCSIYTEIDQSIQEIHLREEFDRSNQMYKDTTSNICISGAYDSEMNSQHKINITDDKHIYMEIGCVDECSLYTTVTRSD